MESTVSIEYAIGVKELKDTLVQTAAAINKDLVRRGESAGQPVQNSENHSSFTASGVYVCSRYDVTSTTYKLDEASSASLYAKLQSSDILITVLSSTCLSITIALVPDPLTAGQIEVGQGSRGPPPTFQSSLAARPEA